MEVLLLEKPTLLGVQKCNAIGNAIGQSQQPALKMENNPKYGKMLSLGSQPIKAQWILEFDQPQENS